MVRLRIWAYNPLKNNIGHASLEVGELNRPGYRYMSVWPAQGANKGRSVTKKYDFEQEDGDCWYQVMYSNLDEAKMLKYWDYLNNNNSLTYADTMYGFNCMTNAALFLIVGKNLDPIEDVWQIMTIQEHWSLMWFSKGMKWGGW